MTNRIPTLLAVGLMASLAIPSSATAKPENLWAGAAKVDITHPNSALVESPLYSRALVIKSESTTVVLVAMDVVSLGQIGDIKDDFLGNVRAKIKADLGINPANIMINTSQLPRYPESRFRSAYRSSDPTGF